jgi:hypothetical protein
VAIRPRERAGAGETALDKLGGNVATGGVDTADGVMPDEGTGVTQPEPGVVRDHAGLEPLP